MKELLDLIKAVAIIYGLVFYCTSGMKCNRSSQAYKDGIIEDYLEKHANDVVESGGVNKDSLIIAAVDVSPSLLSANAATISSTNTQLKKKKGVSGFTLFVGVCVMSVIFYLILKRQKEPQMLRRERTNKDDDRFLETSIRGIPCERVIDVIDGYEKPAWKVGKQGESLRQIQDGRKIELTPFDEHFILKKIDRTINWEIIENIKELWAYGYTNKEVVKEVNTYGYGETNVKAITGCFVNAARSEAIEDKRDAQK